MVCEKQEQNRQLHKAHQQCYFPYQLADSLHSITCVLSRLKQEHLAKLKPLEEAHTQLLAELAAQQQDKSQLLQARDQLKNVTAR